MLLRKVLLALLLAFIVEHAPWRLMALFAESFVVQPGLTRVVQTNNRYWEAQTLQEHIEEMGYAVSYTKGLNVATFFGTTPVFGMTVPGQHTVQVEASLSWDARYAILAHEGGHIFSNSPLYSDEEGEAFAESVAMLVSHDGFREHARYLSNRKLALFTILLFNHAQVYRAAAALTD